MTCPAGILQDQSGVLDRKEADTLLRGARCDGLVCRCMVTFLSEANYEADRFSIKRQTSQYFLMSLWSFSLPWDRGV